MPGDEAVAVGWAGRPLGRFCAFVFNMDGVVTDTAGLHAQAWQGTFDRYLPALSARAGVRDVPFDSQVDYPTYMDGCLRYEAAARFLAARGITLPYGSTTDPPGPATVCALANDNHAGYVTRVDAHGIDVFPATLALIGKLRRWGVRLGVVSSSRDCEATLRSVGLGAAFDVVVGGVEIERLELPGKPDPSAFLEAARRLGLSPRRGVVVEDAVVGVQAARAAGFGLVVGLAHDGAPTLRARLAPAADIVIGELDELEVSTAG